MSAERPAPAAQPSWQKNLYVLTAAQFLIFVAFGFVQPFQALYIKDLGVTDLHSVELWSGVISFSQAFVLSIFSPIWGSYADRHGRRLMVLRVAFGGGLIFATMGLSQNVYQFFGLRMVQGMLTGVIAPGTALAVSFVPRERLGYAMGVLQTSLLAGNSVGPLLGGVLADRFGFRPSFIATGVLMWMAGLLVLLFIKENFVPPERVEGERRGLPAIFQGMRTALADRKLLVIMLVLFSVSFGTSTVTPVLPLFVEVLSPLASAPTLTGIIFTVTGVVSGVTVILLGRISDKVGYKLTLIVMAIGAGLFYIPQAFVRTAGELIVLRGLLGFFDGGIIPTASALVGSRSSSSGSQGSVFGLVYAGGSLGYALGPLVGGILAANLGLRSVFLSTALVLLLVGFYLPFGLREPRVAGPGGGAGG